MNRFFFVNLLTLLSFSVLADIDSIRIGKPPFEDEVSNEIKNDYKNNPEKFVSEIKYYVLSCKDFLNDYNWPQEYRWGSSEIKNYQGQLKEVEFSELGKRGAAIVSHTVIQNKANKSIFSLGRKRGFNFVTIGEDACEPVYNIASEEVAGSGKKVPLNFNGIVGDGVLKSDATIDLFEGFNIGVSGGEFKRTYNGLSGRISNEVPWEEAVLNQKNIEFTAKILGITDIGSKYCRSLSNVYPDSILSWHLVTKHYLAAERLRDQIYNKRKNVISEMANSISASNDSTSQLKSIELQLEAINAIIDSISGSSLFAKDNFAAETRATSRIAWKEKLLTALYNSYAKNELENNELIQSAGACIAGVQSAQSIAQAGCDRKKKIEQCDQNGKCQTVEISDPVPNSCEVTGSYITMIKKGPLEDVVSLYKVDKLPSKILSEKYIRVIDRLNLDVNSIPTSTEAGYDWKSPLNPCLEGSLGKSIKKLAIACTADQSNFLESTTSNVAISSDPLLQIGRDTLGITLKNVEYEFLKKKYAELLKSGKKDTEALVSIRSWLLLETPIGKSYVHSKTLTNAEKTEHNKFLNQLSETYSMAIKDCTASTCNSFVGPRISEPELSLKPLADVNESIKSFLTAVGATSDQLTEAGDFFSKSWAEDDLFLGHTQQRKSYYKLIKVKVQDLIEDDKRRLAEALLQRKSLLAAYKKTEEIVKEIDNSNFNTVENAKNTNANANRNATTASDSIDKIADLGDMTILSNNAVVKLGGKNKEEDNKLSIAVTNASAGRFAVGLYPNFNTPTNFSSNISSSITGSNAVSIRNSLTKFNNTIDGQVRILNKYSSLEKMLRRENKPNNLVEKVVELKKSELSNQLNRVSLAIEKKLMSKALDEINSKISPNVEDTFKSTVTGKKFDLRPNLFTSYMPVAFKLSNVTPIAPSPVVMIQANIKKQMNDNSPSNNSTQKISTNDSESQTVDIKAKSEHIVIPELVKQRDLNPRNYNKNDGDSIFEIITKAHIRSYHNLINRP